MRVSKIALLPFVAGAAFAAPVQHQNAVARDGFPDLGSIFDGGLQLPQIDINEVITGLNQTLGGIIPAIPSDVLTKLEEILGQVEAGATGARLHGQSFNLEGLPDLGDLDLPPFLQNIIEMIIKFLTGLGGGDLPNLPGFPGGPGGPAPTGLPTELPTGFPTELPTGFPTDLPTGFPTDLPGGPLPTETELPPVGLPTELPGGPGETELPPVPLPTETELPPVGLPTDIPGGPGLPTDTEIPGLPTDIPTGLPTETELPGLPTDLPTGLPTDTELPGLPTDLPTEPLPTESGPIGAPIPTDLPTEPLPTESGPIEAPVPTESSPIGAPGPVPPVPTDDGSSTMLPFPGPEEP